MPDFKFALGQRVHLFAGNADLLVVGQTEYVDGSIGYVISFAQIDGRVCRQPVAECELRAQDA